MMIRHSTIHVTTGAAAGADDGRRDPYRVVRPVIDGLQCLRVAPVRPVNPFSTACVIRFDFASEHSGIETNFRCQLGDAVGALQQSGFDFRRIVFAPLTPIQRIVH